MYPPNQQVTVMYRKCQVTPAETNWKDHEEEREKDEEENIAYESETKAHERLTVFLHYGGKLFFKYNLDSALLLIQPNEILTHKSAKFQIYW